MAGPAIDPKLARWSVDPGAVDEDALSPADRFCALACLVYDERDAPPRREAAAALLAEDRGLVDASPYAAAAAADAVALSAHLARDHRVASRAGGPFGWEPLLYLCYARVTGNRSDAEVLAAATALLDAGADPNAGFLWAGLVPPFTALTGVLGEGEQGARRQPRHPQERALAELLLERGADPNDRQALYNRMFTPGTDHVELLFRHGLGGPERSHWRERLGDALETREQFFERQVRWAADHGYADRLGLFASEGIDTSGVPLRPSPWPVDRPNAVLGGRTAAHDAAFAGDLTRLQDLIDRGADLAIRDRAHGATPLDWARHAYQDEAAALIEREGGTSGS